MKIPAKIKAWQLHGFGMDNLKLETIDLPELKPHEILVQVGAVSLNFRDKAVVDGYLGEITSPVIPVADAAGVIVKTGAAVTHLKTGDRVLSHLWSHWLDGDATPEEYKYVIGSPLNGGLAEYMIRESQSVIKIPDFFTDEEASTFPTAGLTAWFSLVNYGKLQSDSTVLVQGSGSVSLFGIQIAKLFGATSIATTSSEVKGAKLKEIGADQVVNYVTTPDWVSEVHRLTGGKGVDHLLEVVGGKGINDSIQAVKYHGQISIIGFLAGQRAEIDLIPLMVKQVRIQGICTGHLHALEDMINAFAEKGIKPFIEKVYSFDQAKEAYAHLAKGSVGKIIIKLPTVD